MCDVCLFFGNKNLSFGNVSHDLTLNSFVFKLFFVTWEIKYISGSACSSEDFIKHKTNVCR